MKYIVTVIVVVCILSVVGGLVYAAHQDIQNTRAHRQAAREFANELPEQWRWFYTHLCYMDRVDRMSALKMIADQSKNSLPKLSREQIDAIMGHLDFYNRGEAFSILSRFAEKGCEKLSLRAITHLCQNSVPGTGGSALNPVGARSGLAAH